MRVYALTLTGRFVMSVSCYSVDGQYLGSNYAPGGFLAYIGNWMKYMRSTYPECEFYSGNEKI